MSIFGKIGKNIAKQVSHAAQFLTSTKVRELSEIDNLVSPGFVVLQERAHKGEPIYFLMLKGGNSRVYVGFTKDQLKDLSHKINDFVASSTS